jgi:Fe-S cluster assembly protein SufD
VSAASSDERLGLIATLFAPAPLQLRISAPLSLEIISLTTPAAGANYLDLALSVDPGVSCQLVERHLGGGAATSFACLRLDLALATNATLVHQRLLAVDQRMVLLDNLHARLQEHASYRLQQIAVGGATSRSTAQVQLQGRGAALNWQALAAGSGRQVNDTMLTVLHQAAGTRSEQLFRAIASEQARIACNTDTQVSAEARGATVTQSLRGLVDGVGAEVDLRPQLTINTDDIQARHGATTGRLDDDLLFYLLSRGLGPDEARALLHWAFLGEVFKSLEPAALRRDAQRLAAARLSAAPAPELLQ